MSNPGYGYQGYNLDQQGQQDMNSLQTRQKLLQAMMGGQQSSAGPYGGLANAGSAIGAALAQRSMQDQQDRIAQNSWARNNPTPMTTANGQTYSVPEAQLPQKQSLFSSFINSIGGGS